MLRDCLEVTVHSPAFRPVARGGIGLGVKIELGLARGRERESSVCVLRRFDPNLKDIQRTETELAAMSREELAELGWRQHKLARQLANRLGADSRPPSSDDLSAWRRRGRQDSLPQNCSQGWRLTCQSHRRVMSFTRVPYGTRGPRH